MTSMRAPDPETDLLTLQQRIVLAEDRLVARQHRLRSRLAEIEAGAREELRPQRLLTPLLGAGLAALVTGWLWHRLTPLLGRGRAPAPAQPPLSAAGLGAGLAWSELLLIAWPLLPARWRRGLTPASASALLALGLPVFRRLVGTESNGPPPATVADVDLARLAGTWFEIARLPAGAASTLMRATTFTPIGDGSALAVQRRSVASTGKDALQHGIAQVVAGSGRAKLRLSLLPPWLRWLPVAWADHWVLHLDTGYNVALIGDPGRRYLSIMARQPQIAATALESLIALAAEAGYPTQRLRIIGHDSGQDNGAGQPTAASP
jgi:apolipoprotein D and lipocalin family protein